MFRLEYILLIEIVTLATMISSGDGPQKAGGATDKPVQAPKGDGNDNQDAASGESEGSAEDEDVTEDDAPRKDKPLLEEKPDMINELESQFTISYDMRPLDIGPVDRSKRVVATEEMIKRISLIQDKVVGIRIRMLLNLMRRANKVTTDIEYKFPEKHGCSVQKYNDLLRQDWPKEYPPGMLNMVRAVKEVLLKSRSENKPISQVDEEVHKRLDFVLNRLGARLKEYGLLCYNIFQDIVIKERRAVRVVCDVPRRPALVDIPDD